MLSLALAFLLTGGPQTSSLATVEGKVFDTMSVLPISGARVVLVRADRPNEQVSFGITDDEPPPEQEDPKASRMTAITTADGTFRFRVEAPARFLLYAEAAGYVTTSRGISQDSIHTAKPGAEIIDIIIGLAPNSSISGWVIDAESGEPIRNLYVEAQRYRHAKTHRILIPEAWTNTDGQGRFKLTGIAPGEYYVQVSAGRKATVGPPKPVEDFRSLVVKDYVPTWYPGAERFEECLPVTVPTGMDVRDIGFKVAKKRMAVLRGRVLGTETAGSAGTVKLSLIGVKKLFQGAGLRSLLEEQLQTGPEFEITPVPPGAYYLSAETGSMAAILPLYVSDENQDNLDLYLRKGVTLTGCLQIEGRAKRDGEPALPSEGMRVSLTSILRMGQPASGVVNSAEGSFTVEAETVDKYNVYVAGAPKGYRVAEVRYNGSPCPSDIVAINASANTHRLEITLAPASGAIAATVIEGSKRAPAAAVVVIPEPVEDDALHFGPALRFTEADADGRATISELLPGTYRVTAYPSGTLWGDNPQFKQELRGGKKVQVAANQATLVEVSAQPRSTSAVSLR